MPADDLTRVGRAELIQIIRELRAELSALNQLVAQQAKAISDYHDRIRELESDSTRKRREGP